MRIGYQGDIGSNNERAAKLFVLTNNIENAKLIPCLTSYNVVKQLQNKSIDLGVMAKENIIVGEVQETKDALFNFEYKLIAENQLKINHCFCTLYKNAKILKIVSHIQAIQQTSIYCKKKYPFINPENYIDTAKAAINNELHIVDENISNIQDNYTIFIMIKML